jgi:hypothetical protein
VVIVTQRRANNVRLLYLYTFSSSLTRSSYYLPSQTLIVDTVIFHLNARTREDTLGVSKKGSFILQGLDVLVEAYLLQTVTDIKIVVLFDCFLTSSFRFVFS